MKKLLLLFTLAFLSFCGCSPADSTEQNKEEIIPLHSNLVAKFGDVEEDYLLYLQEGITEQNITVGDDDISMTLAQTYHDKYSLAMAVDVTLSKELFDTITENYDPSLPLDESAYLPLAFIVYDEPIDNPDGLSATSYVEKYQSYHIPFRHEEISLVGIDTESHSLSYVVFACTAVELSNLDIHMVLSGFVDDSVEPYHSYIEKLYGTTEGTVQYDTLLPLEFSLGEGAQLPEYEIDDLAEGTCYFSPLCYHVTFNQQIDDFPVLSIYTILEDGTKGDMPLYRYGMKNNNASYRSDGYAGWMDTRNIAEVKFDREKTMEICATWDETGE